MENRKLWWVAAICLIIAVVYLVMPIDFIPDLIVGIGWLDDLLDSRLRVRRFTACPSGGAVIIQAPALAPERRE